MKDTKFNQWFCRNWPDIVIGLAAWQTQAKNPILKGALSIVIAFGNSKHKDCATIGK